METIKHTVLFRTDKNSAVVKDLSKIQFTFKKSKDKTTDADCNKCCFKKFEKCASIPCITIQRVDNCNGYYICVDQNSSDFIFNLTKNQLSFKQL